MEQKRKKPVIGIRTKVLIPILLINIVSFLLLGIVVYQEIRTKLIEEGRNSALSVAKLTSSRIDTEKLKNVAEHLARDEDYWSIFEFLSNTEDNTNVTYAYIVGQYEGGYRYLVDTTDTEETAFEDVYPEYLEDTKKSFETDGYCTSEIEHSEFGTLLTASSLIYDSDGTVVALLQVDFDASHIMASVNEIARMIIISGVVLCIISFVIVFLIVNGILGGARKINKKLEELTSNNGDLTQRIEIKSRDEIGIIGGQLNEVLEYIRQIVGNIANATRNINCSMEKMRNSTGKSTEDIEHVSSIMEEMSAMMQETNASLEQITANISCMKKNVEEIYEQVGEGQKLSQNILNEADSILHDAESETSNAKERTDQLTDAVNSKIEQSRNVVKIEELSKRILGITDEISLLALNASIEAARAGEAGRGFTVVADQITQLSNYSAETAKEIQEISKFVVQAVTELALESDEMIQFVSEKTMGGFQQLVQVGKQYQTNATHIQNMYVTLEEKINELESGVKGINEATLEVSQAVEENTKGIAQVAESAVQLNNIIHENHDMAEEGIVLTRGLGDEVDKFII